MKENLPPYPPSFTTPGGSSIRDLVRKLPVRLARFRSLADSDARQLGQKDISRSFVRNPKACEVPRIRSRFADSEKYQPLASLLCLRQEERVWYGYGRLGEDAAHNVYTGGPGEAKGHAGGPKLKGFDFLVGENLKRLNFALLPVSNESAELGRDAVNEVVRTGQVLRADHPSFELLGIDGFALDWGAFDFISNLHRTRSAAVPFNPGNLIPANITKCPTAARYRIGPNFTWNWKILCGVGHVVSDGVFTKQNRNFEKRRFFAA